MTERQQQRGKKDLHSAVQYHEAPPDGERSLILQKIYIMRSSHPHSQTTIPRNRWQTRMSHDQRCNMNDREPAATRKKRTQLRLSISRYHTSTSAQPHHTKDLHHATIASNIPPQLTCHHNTPQTKHAAEKLVVESHDKSTPQHDHQSKISTHSH